VAVLRLNPVLKLLISIGLFTVVVMSSVLIISINRSPGDYGAEVIFVEAELPRIPGEIDVLEVQSMNLSRDQVKLIANSVFNISVDPIYENNSWVFVSGWRELRIYTTGNIRYYDHEKMQKTLLRIEEIMPIDKYIQLARDFVEKLKLYGLIPSKISIELNKSREDVVAYDETIIGTVNGSRTYYVNNVHVNFDLHYDGVRIWGSGGKVRVYFGRDGEIIGFIGDFWNIKSTRKVQLIRPDEAIQKLREVGYGRSMPRSMINRVVIKSVELVYYAPTPGAESTVIIPVYHIRGFLIGKNNEKVEFAQWVPAVY
jgi:hypothetical protein